MVMERLNHGSSAEDHMVLSQPSSLPPRGPMDGNTVKASQKKDSLGNRKHLSAEKTRL